MLSLSLGDLKFKWEYSEFKTVGDNDDPNVERVEAQMVRLEDIFVSFIAAPPTLKRNINYYR